MKKRSLITLIALIFFAFACNQSKTDKEKLKKELKAELKEEMKKEMEKERDSKEQTSNTETVGDPNSHVKIGRTSPTKVNFGIDMLDDLTLYGKKYIVRFKRDNAVMYSLSDGSKKGTISYDGNNLKDATQVFSEKQALIIKIHQDYAIGGIIGIEKTNCKRFSQSEFKYSFKITWENESSLNDDGCAFHNKEEYQTTAKIKSMGAGTGGTIFTFTDTNGKTCNFKNDSRGENLMDQFPDLSPMDSNNPYRNNKYRLFYKFVEVEDHRGFRVEPIVTYIEEIYSVN